MCIQMKLLFILKYTLKYSKIQGLLQTVRGWVFISIKVTDSGICATYRDIARTIRQAWSSWMAKLGFQIDTWWMSQSLWVIWRWLIRFQAVSIILKTQQSQIATQKPEKETRQLSAFYKEQLETYPDISVNDENTKTWSQLARFYQGKIQKIFSSEPSIFFQIVCYIFILILDIDFPIRIPVTQNFKTVMKLWFSR